VPHDLVEPHIKSGRLVSVLDDWTLTYPGYHLYYASRRASPAMTLVVEALRYVEAT
jgi:DNA-binding transcriptional LysR family regulator